MATASPSPFPERLSVAAVFGPVEAPTTFEETVERLGTAIRLGLLGAGTRLPPERELSEQLRIRRPAPPPRGRAPRAARHQPLHAAPRDHDADAERPPGLAARPRGRHVRGRRAAGGRGPRGDRARGALARPARLPDRDRGRRRTPGRRARPAGGTRAHAGARQLDGRRARRLHELPARRRLLPPGPGRGGRVPPPRRGDDRDPGRDERADRPHRPPACGPRPRQPPARAADQAAAPRRRGARRPARPRAPPGHRAHPRRPAAVSDGAPLIGVCLALERARFGAWEADAVLLPRSYVDAVQAAGGLALMLPPDPLVTGEPDRVLDLIDGLILAGGRDVDPVTYGEDPHPATDQSRPERDHFELALARRAMERDMPFLGICRGMQAMNVARGGTVAQDLPAHL